MFCIEPGAGIGGIGNGFKVAPVQYPFTAFPNSLSIGDVGNGLPGFVSKTF